MPLINLALQLQIMTSAVVLGPINMMFNCFNITSLCISTQEFSTREESGKTPKFTASVSNFLWIRDFRPALNITVKDAVTAGSRGDLCIHKDGLSKQLMSTPSSTPLFSLTLTTVSNCPNSCRTTVFRSELKTHMNFDCGRRLISCQFCGEAIYHDDEFDHAETCDHFPVQRCPRGCNAKITTRKEVLMLFTVHINNILHRVPKKLTPKFKSF